MTHQPLSPRQHRLLQHLHELRFATTGQLARLTIEHYRTPRSALRQTSRHLHHLEQQQHVLRLERRIGGWQGGSTPAIWALTTRGQRHLSGQRRGVRQRPRLISTTFLEHRLATTETCLIATETIRAIPQATLAIQTEPTCWRHFLGPHGQPLTLRPDLHLAITTPAYHDRYFIEIDRATENPARVIATCWRYVHYQQLGIEQQSSGLFPAVLWVVPHQARRTQLARHLAEAQLPDGLFHSLTLAELPALLRDGPPTTHLNPDQEPPEHAEPPH